MEASTAEGIIDNSFAGLGLGIVGTWFAPPHLRGEADLFITADAPVRVQAFEDELGGGGSEASGSLAPRPSILVFSSKP